jgi:hypothetical protein
MGTVGGKVGLAVSILIGSAGLSRANEFEGFDGLDFGALVQRGFHCLVQGLTIRGVTTSRTHAPSAFF